jgi:hypothetical protein
MVPRNMAVECPELFTDLQADRSKDDGFFYRDFMVSSKK